MAKRLILCDCAGSQSLDSNALEEATGVRCSRVHSALCTAEIESAARFIQEGDAILACQQEAPRFEELAAELTSEIPHFVDIRDRAGWSDDVSATAKMAALIAESQVQTPTAKSLDVTSEGVCLVMGTADIAYPVAERLSRSLAVTVLVTDDEDPPLSRDFEVIRGRLKRAQGSMGHFRLRIDQLQILQPAGRGAFTFTAPRDGAETECDVILDLSGGTPLFPAPHKRDGYLRADPGHAGAVQDATFDAAHYIGTFEKTLFLALDSHLCAHSRAEQTGCTRCLDICPTGAISPDGEHVAVDPMICAGCGACASLCPSGAIKYDAPPVGAVLARLRALAETYLAAGGQAPRLLVHDDSHGAEMIRLAARFGRGLPADVLPLSVDALASFGHAEILAALSMGFADIRILPAPRTEREPIASEIELAEAMGGAGRIAILDVGTPDAMSDALFEAKVRPQDAAPKLLMGDRRQIARMAAKALMPNQETPVPLSEDAPYGAIVVDKDVCTLCLSCVSLCPSAALVDNPDKPELRFQEDACLQCGLCANICPENAIALEPRFDPSDDVMKLRTLHEEEPFCCIECGAPFGVKSTVERIVEKLEGKHSMFAEEGAGRLIRMCNDCRIQAQYHSTDNPFATRERQTVRTTEDYLSKRRDH
ncbi:4Fe-4S dicluster domain-containing protein [Salinihabitans flavidus]|uniref:4Fe-4S dicluster domain-containing protein n=1 Tax=Salinihabitans flavidus TaxID=569882 RepID=A0A1H8PS30_9RHOB|nr:4Fe-4S binding protein [Salinihabitans flavidus]SEO44809.1 4Fe-4S dicluster domain-containing protein [Salinihabitans flavidus]